MQLIKNLHIHIIIYMVGFARLRLFSEQQSSDGGKVHRRSSAQEASDNMCTVHVAACKYKYVCVLSLRIYNLETCAICFRISWRPHAFPAASEGRQIRSDFRALNDRVDSGQDRFPGNSRLRNRRRWKE